MMAGRSVHRVVPEPSAAAAAGGRTRCRTVVSFANQARHTVSRAARICFSTVGEIDCASARRDAISPTTTIRSSMEGPLGWSPGKFLGSCLETRQHPSAGGRARAVSGRLAFVHGGEGRDSDHGSGVWKGTEIHHETFQFPHCVVPPRRMFVGSGAWRSGFA